MKRGSFTLIELIVIVAIVAILTSLLFTAMDYARTQVKETGCRGNLKNISESLAMYSSDHNNDMAEGDSSSDLEHRRFYVFDIASYLGYENKVYPIADSKLSLWYKDPCLGLDKSDRYELPDVLKCGFRQDDGYVGYGWNYWYIHGGPALNNKGTEWNRIKFGQVRRYHNEDPQIVKRFAEQMILGDNSNAMTNRPHITARYGKHDTRISQRHLKGDQVGGNYLFMDGHVDWISKSFIVSKESRLHFWTVYE